MGDNYKEYHVSMSWDSYEGSLFRETHTSWYYAYSREEAIEKARSEYGANNGFRIESY